MQQPGLIIQKSIGVTVFLLAIVFSGGASKADTSQWTELEMRARAQVERQNYSEALRTYRSALDLADQHPNGSERVVTLIEIGNCYYRMGDDATAKKYIKDSQLAEAKYEAQNPHSWVTVDINGKGRLAEAADMLLTRDTKAYEKGIDILRMNSDPGAEPPTLHMLATAVRRKLHVPDDRKLPVVLVAITSCGAYYVGQIKKTSGDKHLDDDVLTVLPGLRFTQAPTAAIVYTFLFDLNAPEKNPVQQSIYTTSKCVVMTNHPAEIDEYILDILKRIRAVWHNGLPHSPCIQLDLKANGKVSDIKILRTTGRADRDAAAKSAISTITFAPIPWFVKGDFLSFELNLGTQAEIKSQPYKGKRLRLTGDGITFSSGGCAEHNKGQSVPPSRVLAPPSHFDANFMPYMSDLQARIGNHWHQPNGAELKRVVVRFKVHTFGEMSDLRIEQSSGVAPTDNAALKAVEDAAPFKPLPSGSLKNVYIRCVFDKNFISAEKIN